MCYRIRSEKSLFRVFLRNLRGSKVSLCDTACRARAVFKSGEFARSALALAFAV